MEKKKGGGESNMLTHSENKIEKQAPFTTFMMLKAYHTPPPPPPPHALRLKTVALSDAPCPLSASDRVLNGTPNPPLKLISREILASVAVRVHFQARAAVESVFGFD